MRVKQKGGILATKQECSLHRDRIFLGNGAYFETGEPFVNDNIIAVGSTGSGKTTGVVVPRLETTTYSSLVVPVCKAGLYEKYAPLLKERGYRVLHLNLKNPGLSTCGYNPLAGKTKDYELLSLAKAVVGEKSRSILGDIDSYWSDSATNVIAAMLTVCDNFSEFTTMGKKLRASLDDGRFRTNYDAFFEGTGGEALRLWEPLVKNAPKTASCIYSMVKNSLVHLDAVSEIFGKTPVLDIKTLGKEKTALFVSTSAGNPASKKIADVFYYDLFKTLMTEAEKEESGKLPVPVQVVADDFACGSIVPEFDSYISLFRQAGISATLVLQSFSQLESTYGRASAQTICDNCDTVLYFGSSDLETCRKIALYLDCPVSDVLRMPVSNMAVIRRGREPMVIKRT